MATKKESLEQLRKVPLFSVCSTKDLEKVLKAGDEIAATAGRVILEYLSGKIREFDRQSFG